MPVHFGDKELQPLKNKALEGDVHSQLQLGFIYSKGPLEDKKEALHWMTMAAGKGIPSACRYLGFAYLEGKGTAQNNNLAKKWFTVGSRIGDTFVDDRARRMPRQGKRKLRARLDFLAEDLGEPSIALALGASMAGLECFGKNEGQARGKQAEIKATKGAFKGNSGTVRSEKQFDPGKRIRYRGAIQNEIPHGFGERISPDGEIYQGSFRGGKEEWVWNLVFPQRTDYLPRSLEGR